MGTQVKFVNEEFDSALLERFLFAFEGIKGQYFVTEKPLTSEKAVEFLGISKRSFYNLIKNGQIKAHRFKGLDTPFYYPSEMNESLKKS